MYLVAFWIDLLLIFLKHYNQNTKIKAYKPS